MLCHGPYRYTDLMSTIYRLRDPRTNAIRYLGYCSRRPETRLNEHLSRARQGLTTCHRDNWLRSLQDLGLRPRIDVLSDKFPPEKWEQVERYWIAVYRLLGHDLTNVTDGGEGYVNWTEESRKKLSAARMGLRRNIGVPHSPERRAAISRGKTGKKLSEAHRESMKAAYSKPEILQKNRMAQPNRVPVVTQDGMMFDGIKEAARHLGVHHKTIRRWIRQGLIQEVELSRFSSF